MGEINVPVEFENASDRAVYERGYIPESEIRTYKVRATSYELFIRETTFHQGRGTAPIR